MCRPGARSPHILRPVDPAVRSRSTLSGFYHVQGHRDVLQVQVERTQTPIHPAPETAVRFGTDASENAVELLGRGTILRVHAMHAGCVRISFAQLKVQLVLQPQTPVVPAAVLPGRVHLCSPKGQLKGVSYTSRACRIPCSPHFGHGGCMRGSMTMRRKG